MYLLVGKSREFVLRRDYGQPIEDFSIHPLDCTIVTLPIETNLRLLTTSTDVYIWSSLSFSVIFQQFFVMLDQIQFPTRRANPLIYARV